MEVDQTTLNCLTNDEFYMGVAIYASKQTKDQYTKSGACIVNNLNQIVGIGWNRMPFGISDTALSWDRVADGTKIDLKFKYVTHAVFNAYFNRTEDDLSNCRLYVTLFPTNECVKIINEAGIREVIYLEDELKIRQTEKAADIMLKKSNINIRQLFSSRQVLIDFKDLGHYRIVNSKQNFAPQSYFKESK